MLEDSLKQEKSYGRIRKAIYAGVTALSLFLASCCQPNIPPKPAEEPPKLSAKTKIIQKEEAPQIYSVSENSVTFTQPKSYSVGDIIVSDVSDTAPEGLLRKVVSSSGNTIYTSPATLEEAIANCSIKESKSISSKEISPKYLASLMFDFTLKSPESIWEMNGRYIFSADMNLELKIEESKLEKFAISASTTRSTIISLSSSEAFGKITDETFNLKHIKLPTWTIYIPTIPPLPIVITSNLDFTSCVKGNVSFFKANAWFTEMFIAGLRYENNSWNPIARFDYSLNIPEEPQFKTTLDVKASVGAELTFAVYGLAGPAISVDAYANLISDPVKGLSEIYSGIESLASIKAGFLGKNLLNFSTKLIDLRKKVWEYQSPLPPDDIPEEDFSNKILVVSNKSGNRDIYLVNPADLTQRNVTNSWYNEENPFWIDKVKGIFGFQCYDIEGNSEIYKRKIGETTLTNLTNNSSNDFSASASSDGNTLVFCSDRKDNKSDLFLMDANGSNQHLVSTSSGNDMNPDFSPDGKYLIFSSDIMGEDTYNIYKLTLATNDLKRLTSNVGNNIYATYSPDGSKIAFCSNRETLQYYDIWIMNSFGDSSPKNLSDTSISLDDIQPSYSEDGTKLAYTFGNVLHPSSSFLEVYTMNSSDGSNKTPITNLTETSNIYHMSPKWRK